MGELDLYRAFQGQLFDFHTGNERPKKGFCREIIQAIVVGIQRAICLWPWSQGQSQGHFKVNIVYKMGTHFFDPENEN